MIFFMTFPGAGLPFGFAGGGGPAWLETDEERRARARARARAPGPHPFAPRVNVNVSALFPILLVVCAATAPQLGLPLSMLLMMFQAQAQQWAEQGRPFTLGADDAFKIFAFVVVCALLFYGSGSGPVPDALPPAGAAPRAAHHHVHPGSSSVPGSGSARPSSHVSSGPGERQVPPSASRYDAHAHANAFDDDDDEYGSSLQDEPFLLELVIVLTFSLFLFVSSRWPEVHRWLVRALPPAASRAFQSAVDGLGLRPAPGPRGLTPTAPDVIASLERVHTDGTEGDCSVCLEAFKRGETVRRLACRHMFHEGCIMPWLEQRSSCPSCRCDLNDPAVARARAASGSSPAARAGPESGSAPRTGSGSGSGSDARAPDARSTGSAGPRPGLSVRARLAEVLGNVGGSFAGLGTGPSAGLGRGTPSAAAQPAPVRRASSASSVGSGGARPGRGTGLASLRERARAWMGTGVAQPRATPPNSVPSAYSLSENVVISRRSLESLSVRQLREFAARERVDLAGALEKSDIVDMILAASPAGSSSSSSRSSAPAQASSARRAESEAEPVAVAESEEGRRDVVFGFDFT